MKTDYDVIVIGSGFGGAITACRLAQAGHSVCLLEKGRRWPRENFPRSPGEVSRSAFSERGQTGPGDGFIEYLSFRNMDVVQGTGLGGGSLHYFNVHMQPPAFVFEQPAWPRSLTLRKLKPYYSLAATMLGAQSLDAGKGHRVPPRTRVFEDAVDSAGHTAERVPICVELDADAVNGCEHCGNCLLGCHKHAKNTLDLNYIAEAERHGAHILTRHKALAITPRESGYQVACQNLAAAPADPRASSLRQLQADRVIVAAGTLGTTELLLRCKHQFRTLPRLSPRLGERYSGNGDFLFAGTRYVHRLTDPGRGPSITAGVGFRDSADQFIYIEDLGFPDPFIWHFNGALPTRGRLANLLRQAGRYLPGSKHRFDIDELLKDGLLTNFLPYLGMGTDAADGRLFLNRQGRLDLHWSVRRSLPMFRQMVRHMENLSYHSGGTFLNSVFWETPLFRLPLYRTLTAHPLGGCALSESPLQGVTRDDGQVWGYPGLYVADGSLLPSAVGVNPSATISAIAERVAFRMIHGRDLQANDRQAPAGFESPATASTGAREPAPA